MPLYGPNALQSISADGIGWAQRRLWHVPDALGWAQQTPNYSHRWGRLGPALFSAGAPNDLVRA
jgi:hypothetical protein